MQKWSEFRELRAISIKSIKSVRFQKDYIIENSQVYSEFSQLSKVELFEKKVNDRKQIPVNKSDWVVNTPLKTTRSLTSFSFDVTEISPKNKLMMSKTCTAKPKVP